MTPTITLIDTTRLKPNPNNPRKNIGDITALADSIRAHGIQQELVVTPIADSTDYRVVIGHRRLAASQQAGLAQVPCRIMELSPKDERELMVIENTQRHDLTPIEEADAYQGLLDLGSSIEDMAEKTGRSTDFVRRRLKIAGIPRLTRALAKDFNQLSLSDLDVLAEFQGDETTQQELARQAGTNNWDWTVRKAREERKGTVWMNKALDYLHRAGLKTCQAPSNWWNDAPEGYQYSTCITNIQNTSFEKQWQKLIGSKPNIDAIIGLDETDHRTIVYERIPQDQIDNATRAKQAEKQRRAYAREQTKKARELHDASQALRAEWIHKTQNTWKKPMMQQALLHLVDGEILGNDEYRFPAGSGDINWSDKTIAAYAAAHHRQRPRQRHLAHNHRQKPRRTPPTSPHRQHTPTPTHPHPARTPRSRHQPRGMDQQKPAGQPATHQRLLPSPRTARIQAQRRGNTGARRQSHRGHEGRRRP